MAKGAGSAIWPTAAPSQPPKRCLSLRQGLPSASTTQAPRAAGRRGQALRGGETCSPAYVACVHYGHARLLAHVARMYLSAPTIIWYVHAGMWAGGHAGMWAVVVLCISHVVERHQPSKLARQFVSYVPTSLLTAQVIESHQPSEQQELLQRHGMGSACIARRVCHQGDEAYIGRGVSHIHACWVRHMAVACHRGIRSIAQRSGPQSGWGWGQAWWGTWSGESSCQIKSNPGESRARPRLVHCS